MRIEPRLWLFTLAFLAAASTVQAQSSGPGHERSVPVADGRFELVQSPHGARYTFRFDRHLGYVDQLVMSADSTLSWERIPRIPHPAGDTQNAGRPNYQFFTSSTGIRFTFLINVNTGAAWQLVSAEKDQLVWDPIG